MKTFLTLQRVDTAEIVIDQVSAFTGVSDKLLRGPSRAPCVARPRMLAMYLCRALTPLSYQSIGQMFGGRNHSTVMSGVRKVDALKDTDESLGDAVEALRQSILAAASIQLRLRHRQGLD